MKMNRSEIDVQQQFKISAAVDEPLRVSSEQQQISHLAMQQHTLSTTEHRVTVREGRSREANSAELSFFLSTLRRTYTSSTAVSKTRILPSVSYDVPYDSKNQTAVVRGLHCLCSTTSNRQCLPRPAKKTRDRRLSGQSRGNGGQA